MYLLFNPLIYPSICLLFNVSNTCTSLLFASKYLYIYRGLLRVPWAARRSNQHILKEISPEYSSRSWWWTGRTCMLQSMGSQRVGQDWATELNWTELIYILIYNKYTYIYLFIYVNILFITYIIYLCKYTYLFTFNKSMV